MKPLVVIIDDDLDLLHMAKRYLERAEMQWRTFPLGRQALAWLAESDQPIAVVVVDLGLPDISGFDVCRELRDHPRTAEVPLLVMSSREGLDIEARASEVGARQYLSKPLRSRTLLDAVEPFVRAAQESP